jgi:hypothetical protein
VISTTLNFLYFHKEEEFVWLPALVWAVVLWQSFLGWWWVGAGSGGRLTGKDDDVEEKLKRRAVPGHSLSFASIFPYYHRFNARNEPKNDNRRSSIHFRHSIQMVHESITICIRVR